MGTRLAMDQRFLYVVEDYDIKRIKDRAEAVIAQLAAELEDHRAFVGNKSQKVDSGLGLDITTPINVGRIRFRWATEDSKLSGRLVVLAQQNNFDGEEVWREVWHINIPSNGYPYYGDPDAGDIATLGGLRESEDAWYEAAATLIHLINFAATI